MYLARFTHGAEALHFRSLLRGMVDDDKKFWLQEGKGLGTKKGKTVGTKIGKTLGTRIVNT